jgi:hypothetical protein
MPPKSLEPSERHQADLPAALGNCALLGVPAISDFRDARIANAYDDQFVSSLSRDTAL